ncbi:MAG: hypothetical protein DHS20C17_00600 [Cyclobacteriaceae bacterium]|nr:MAG: hypothetical protein DHS20C17_00600 [Cyclobacteriaceae bacterium]
MILCAILLSCTQEPTGRVALQATDYDLQFDQLSPVWDEAIPLGNGMVGALIWQKEGKLRFSLDRADLWDLRPMANLNTPEWSYRWVYEQWKKDDYKPVQDKFDVPYDNSPAPSKIPGAALEFDISDFGEVESVHLHLSSALCEIKWESGVKLITFVHSTEPLGWFRFEGIDKLNYHLIPPAYNVSGTNESENPVTGQDLRRLGYPEGKVVRNDQAITFEQQGWGGFSYQVHVNSVSKKGSTEGCWSISSEFPGWDKKTSALEVIDTELKEGFDQSFISHKDWWSNFWNKSNIKVPDPVLQKQWMLEQYKFGSAARVGAPPISLQAVWTADNGKLPPWKGDFHHDLNTQLSYWPAYSGNHLEEEVGFIDWLWKYRDTFKKYTETYYESAGINVPGVTTLMGEPMGGWIQYSFGPTVSAWLAQHFYWHWRYSMDREFLEQKAYPWIKEVAVYFEQVSQQKDDGKRQLPISSSPEIHDNSRDAWFGSTTNFDLALIRWTYLKAAELARELGNEEETSRWETNLSQWPELTVNAATGLMLAPDAPYDQSHRHFSHQLAYHPLGLIDYANGDDHQKIIDNTISTLEDIGSQAWVGYSFSWMGGLKARAFDGEGAAEYLKIFATSFCLPNSFHVNGDQSGKGYSSYTYRPFTLEGNFAFAAGLQEMLIQSHTGVVHIFPALPKEWKDVSFNQLRTQGAYLVSAKKENGMIRDIEIKAEKGGVLKLKNPYPNADFYCSKDYKLEVDNIVIKTNEGDTVRLFSEN